MKRVEIMKVFHVNAFATEPFKGNPAAVVVLTKMKDTVWMQTMARELNQPATAFVAPHEDPFKRVFRLAWFTPSAEIPLCGHGTLAAAYVLWTEGILRPDLPAVFETRAGKLTARYDFGSWITLDFPAITTVSAETPAGLFAALGIESAVEVRADAPFYVVVVDSAETVRSLQPDFSALARLAFRAVTVTAQSDDGKHHIISRQFAPSIGLDEDAVTGSAHCRLAPYWVEKLGRQKLLAYQASARGGSLKVALDGDRVKLSGRAITLIKGEIQLQQ